MAGHAGRSHRVPLGPWHELTLARGRLLARSRSPIRVDDRELIEKARELIVGRLKGQPVMCGRCAEPAVSIADPDAPMCDEHLKG